MALSYEAFMELTKPNAYQIYSDVCRKLEEKDKFIQEVVLGLHQKLMPGDHESTTSSMVNCSSSNCGEKVRDMSLIPLNDRTENLILGSSIIAKLENDPNIPEDSAVHAYRGSTTKEKIYVLKKNNEREIKTLILQDGTNSVLKTDKNESEIFEDYSNLVEACIHKFNPDNIILCEVLPLKNQPQFKSKNDTINDFNKLLGEHFANKSKFKALPRYKMISQISRFDSMYHDNVHLNYRTGIRWFKNQLLAQLMLTSNGVCKTELSGFYQSSRGQRNPLAQRRIYSNNKQFYRGYDRRNYNPY